MRDMTNNVYVPSHRMMCAIKLKMILAGLLLAFTTNAAVSIEHYDQLDYYDWQEQRGYNLERDLILEIGEWNRRELEGHWPEVDYTYWEWDDDWYYEDEEEE
jgi:hypothetical protein